MVKSFASRRHGYTFCRNLLCIPYYYIHVLSIAISAIKLSCKPTFFIGLRVRAPEVSGICFYGEIKKKICRYAVLQIRKGNRDNLGIISHISS